MKTETMTIRLTQDDKQLITNLAWSRHMSVAKLLVSLAREADQSDREAAGDLAAIKDQIADLRREVTELMAHRPQSAVPDADDQADPGVQEEYTPGESPDCNPLCRWYLNGDCRHPDYEDAEGTTLILGQCSHWAPPFLPK